MRSRTVLILALALIGPAGCGEDAEPEPAATASPTQRGKTGEPPPSELLGAYATTLKDADVPAKAPPELAGQRKWLMRITKDGGPDNAPALTILRPPSDPLESSRLSTSAGTLTLHREECAPTDPGGQYTLVTSSYQWKLTGRTLRVTTVKAGCPDKVADTILTARPWTKQQ